MLIILDAPGSRMIIFVFLKTQDCEDPRADANTQQWQSGGNTNKGKILLNAVYIWVLNSIQFTSIFPYKGFDLRLHSSSFKILLMICIFVCVTKNT